MSPFTKERELKPGDTIWVYIIDRHLGRGAFGDVYLAHHSRMLNRRVAIKRLKTSQASQPVVKRFVHEAYAMGELFHPNVILIFELIEPDQYPNVDSYYIVMEYMDGGTLREWMQRADKPLATLPDTIRIVKDMLRGLAVAHQEQIFHRDLKPENILLSRDGAWVKVGDWGLAHLEDYRMTQVGTIMGTVSYMPPEQASGDSADVDGRADLYSVGVMLYEMVTGSLCLDFQTISDNAVQRFLERNPNEYRNRVMLQQVARDACYEAIEHTPRIDPANFVPDMPRELRSVLLKATAIRREDRYQTAADFISALDELLKAQTTSRIRQPARSSSYDERISRVATLLVQARQQRQDHAYSRAVELLQSARGIIKGDPGVCLELARIYNMMGRHEDAVQILEEADKANPDNHVILRDLGMAYLKINRPKAVAILRRSLQVNPNQPQIARLVQKLDR